MTHPGCNIRLARNSDRSHATSSLIIRSIDEISTSREIGIQQSERRVLIHRAEAMRRPLVTNAHAAKGHRGDMDGSAGCQLTITGELGWRRRRRREEWHGGSV